MLKELRNFKATCQDITGAVHTYIICAEDKWQAMKILYRIIEKSNILFLTTDVQAIDLDE